jgi:ATP-dependent helicase/nuclease subunit B
LLRFAQEPDPDEAHLLFLAADWNPPIVRSAFQAAAWSSDTGVQLRRTLAALLAGIRNGHFFIVPDRYCETCEFRAACRYEHTSSWWRAHRAGESRALRSLRALKVKGA